MKATLDIISPIKIQQQLELDRITVLLGTNKSGKTTVLSCLANAGEEAIILSDNVYNPVGSCKIDEKIDVTYYIDSTGIHMPAPIFKLTKKSDILDKVVNDIRNDLNKICNPSSPELNPGDKPELTPRDILCNDEIDNMLAPIKTDTVASRLLNSLFFVHDVSKSAKVLLLLDDVVNNVYPATAYLLGRVISSLVNDNLYVVTSTYNWDFFAGLMKQERLRIYYMRMKGGNISINEVKVSINEITDMWYLPGFTLSVALAVISKWS